jgi:hypothetical protein
MRREHNLAVRKDQFTVSYQLLPRIGGFRPLFRPKDGRSRWANGANPSDSRGCAAANMRGPAPPPEAFEKEIFINC